MLVAALASCKGEKSGSSDSKAADDDTDISAFKTATAKAEDKVETQSFETASDEFNEKGEVNGSTYEVTVAGKYPEGSDALSRNIREWLNAQFPAESPSYTGTNVTNFVDIKGIYFMKAVVEELNGIELDDWQTNYDFDYRFEPIYEDEDVVTYLFGNYVYTGGAHGGSTVYGQTFLKETGRPLTMNDLLDTTGSNREYLLELIKSAMWEQYFNATENDYSSLSDALLINPDELDFPAAAPFISDKGLSFIYQQYEIAPYSAGMPECTLSWDVLLGCDLMTVLGYNLIP